MGGFKQLTIIGSTLGSIFRRYPISVWSRTSVPTIDRVLPLDRAREGFQAMLGGAMFERTDVLGGLIHKYHRAA